MLRRSPSKKEVIKAPLRNEEYDSDDKIHKRSYLSARRLQMKRPVYTFTVLFVSIMVLYTISKTLRDSAVPIKFSGNPSLSKTNNKHHKLDASPRMVQLIESNSNQVKSISPLRNVTRTQSPSMCVPTHKWQLPEFGPSSCNTMHEIMSRELKFINCGSSRCAFEIQDEKGHSMVLKIPMLSSDHFEPDFVEAGWRDTIAMERCSSSPFVLSIFGNCGVSQITEVGQSSLFDLINLSRLQGKDNMSPEDKLRIGFHLASGIADVHFINGNEKPSFVHNDVDASQIILVDGVYKISDFHMGTIIKYNDTSGEACPESPHYVATFMDKGRPPEELKYKSDDYPDTYVNRDKADVWCLGDMLYNVLTKRWMFEGISLEKSIAKIIHGRVLDGNPFASINRTDPSNKAMMEAIQWAWTYDPDERPSARKIANFLKRNLDETKDGSPWRVSIPPLPRNYKYPDFGDFRATYET